ncbi:flavin reductase [Pelagibius sp.]|uniref:flavin reductase n=1 Tax=Pelagibius sp. TaxID=1931238 RepID=UPI003BAF77D9
MQLTDDQIAFREGMSRMGAAVNLITTDGPAGKHGLIASAVCSVTDAPPTLLVCINRKAFVHDRFLNNFHVCVNVLAAQHQDLCNTFARYIKGVDRWAQGSWITKETGCPVLEDANVAFDCRIGSLIEQGSHSVMFCEVKAVHLGTIVRPGLVYFSRDFHHLHAPSDSAA